MQANISTDNITQDEQCFDNFFFVQYYLSALPYWLANIYVNEMDCKLAVSLSLTASKRQIFREKQAECITSSKCYSSVSGCKDRWLLSIAGDEKQVCVSTCSLFCAVCWWLILYTAGLNVQGLLGSAVRGPLLQAIKQAIMLLLLLKNILLQVFLT